MRRIKRSIFYLSICLIAFSSFPQIANSKPAYCDQALEECREIKTGFVFWDLGVELGCSIGYANCG